MDINDSIKKEITEISTNDYISILKLAKKIKKKEPASNNIKIAVIGSCSLQYFVMVLRLFLFKYDLAGDFFEGEYDGINMAVFDSHSELYKFSPDIVIILSNYRDIRNFPELFSLPHEIDDFVISQGKYYQKLWKRISKIQGCHIFQSNIVIPLERECGNIEANLYCSRRTIYNMINLELIKIKAENVTIIDMEYMAEFLGKEKWFDYTSYFSSKIEYSLKYIGIVCDMYAQQIAALQGKIKKCLVLDLDNTLWGGIVADEGANGISIGPNDAIGEAYSFFQQYVLNLRRRGVILAVVSKNDYQLAKEPFEVNDNMILKYSDFSVFIANWDTKASNIELVAQKLQIGIESLVFFDDNPAEREIVRKYHPDVLVIDVPENVAEYVLALERAHPFDWIDLTKEDVSRADSYKANAEREKLCVKFEDYQEFLLNLAMKGSVEYLQDKDITRFTQLINKSNQFNVRTQRYSIANIKSMLSNGDCQMLAAKLEDRFSKFGIIACVILHKKAKECFIDTWVMSCRVLKRDVENFTFRKMIDAARNWGCKVIIGEYIPTEKNEYVKDLFPMLGFCLLVKKDDGTEIYMYDLSIEFEKKIVIEEIN